MMDEVAICDAGLAQPAHARAGCQTAFVGNDTNRNYWLLLLSHNGEMNLASHAVEKAVGDVISALCGCVEDPNVAAPSLLIGSCQRVRGISPLSLVPNMFTPLPPSESQTRRDAALKGALAPIAEYLADERIVEIMLNADGAVWIERLGAAPTRTASRMAAAEAERLLRWVASEVPVELNADHPSLSARMPPPWSARLQAAIPPIAPAPVFALRKPARFVFSLEDYVEKGIVRPKERDALVSAVLARDNILIGGGTGSGKTTFANALVKVIADETTDRVHIIEDTPELQCEAPNKIQILIAPKVHTWRDAIMAAMRFRPDRILVGEVRDGSALELLKAWNTGHPGGVATIHANSTRAMLDRMCQLIEEVVHPAPRALVAETIQICVHIGRDKTHPAGRRLTGLDRVGPIGPDGRWNLEPLA